MEPSLALYLPLVCSPDLATPSGPLAVGGKPASEAVRAEGNAFEGGRVVMEQGLGLSREMVERDGWMM